MSVIALGEASGAGRQDLLRGLSCLDAGDRPRAAIWFDRARRIAPESPLPLLLMASALCVDDPVTSLAHLDVLIARDPDHAAARVARLAILRRLDRHDRGAEELDEFLRTFAVPLGGEIDLAAVSPATDETPLDRALSLLEAARACRSSLIAGIDPWRPLPVALAGLLPCSQVSIPPRADIAVIVMLDGPAKVPAADLSALGQRYCVSTTCDSGGGLRSVNEALRKVPGRDVLLLRGSIWLDPAAIARLAEAAYCDAAIGTATPIATGDLLATRVNPEAFADLERLAELDRTLCAANQNQRVTTPVVGADCVFIRHDCLAEVGQLREDIGASVRQGMADFSLRAAHFGWRHVVACDVLTADARKTVEPALDQAIIENLHPGHDALVAGWKSSDPLQPVRFRFDAALWATGRKRNAIILVTHDDGGGVERVVAERCRALQNEHCRIIVVRPRGNFAISDGTSDTHPNLRFGTVQELAGFLRDDRPVMIEFHHIAAYSPTVVRLPGLLRVPFEYFVHDFAAICPRVTLLRGAFDYCGEPADRRDCEDCIADHGARIPFAGSVAEHHDRYSFLLRSARRVVAPSRDSADRLSRFIPGINLAVVPWEEECRIELRRRRAAEAKSEIVVGVVGAIGEDKGFRILLACARDAMRRMLPLQFVVVGHTIDDERLIATDRAFVTGRFEEGEARALLERFQPDLGFIPSVWPETWCFALSALWEFGLHVTAFDLGAQAERIRSTGGGSVLPLAANAATINDHFLNTAAHG